MTKVILIDPLIGIRKKDVALSTTMIKTLVAACNKQSKKEAFGPRDIKGSFLPLINRGFINTEEKTVNGRTVIIWYVTKSALETLKSLGIQVKC